jgi:hypothetical protein
MNDVEVVPVSANMQVMPFFHSVRLSNWLECFVYVCPEPIMHRRHHNIFGFSSVSTVLRSGVGKRIAFYSIILWSQAEAYGRFSRLAFKRLGLNRASIYFLKSGAAL